MIAGAQISASSEVLAVFLRIYGEIAVLIVLLTQIGISYLFDLVFSRSPHFGFYLFQKFVYRLGSTMIGRSSYNVDCEQVREVVVQDVQTQILGRLLEREIERLEVDKVGDLRLGLVPRTIGIDCAIQVDTVELDELWYKCVEQRAMYMLEYEKFDDFNVDDWWYAWQFAEDVDNLWRLDPMWAAKVFQVELNSPRLCRKCFARPRYFRTYV